MTSPIRRPPLPSGSEHAPCHPPRLLHGRLLIVRQRAGETFNADMGGGKTAGTRGRLTAPGSSPTVIGPAVRRGARSAYDRFTVRFAKNQQDTNTAESERVMSGDGGPGMF